MGTGASFDEILAPAINKRLGPLVGLGNPNDYLPAPGVGRVYQNDANWQETVLDLLGRAGAVILVEGETPSFCWELSQVRKLCPPEKVFVVTPLAPYRLSNKVKFGELLREAGFALPELNVAGTLVPVLDVAAGSVVGFDEWHRAVVLRENLTTADGYARVIRDAHSTDPESGAGARDTPNPTIACARPLLTHLTESRVRLSGIRRCGP